MNRNPSNRNEEKLPAFDLVNFIKWTAMISVGHAIGVAIFTVFVGIVLNLPPHRLLVPYSMLAYCGLILAPLLYWARLVGRRPRAYAIRFAIATFLYSQALMLALGLGAIRVGLLSQVADLSGYAPYMELISILASGAAYIAIRQTPEPSRG